MLAFLSALEGADSDVGRRWQQMPRRIEVQSGGRSILVQCKRNAAAAAAVAAFRSTQAADWAEGAKIGAWRQNIHKVDHKGDII